MEAMLLDLDVYLCPTHFVSFSLSRVDFDYRSILSNTEIHVHIITWWASSLVILLDLGPFIFLEKLMTAVIKFLAPNQRWAPMKLSRETKLQTIETKE